MYWVALSVALIRSPKVTVPVGDRPVRATVAETENEWTVGSEIAYHWLAFAQVTPPSVE